GGDQALAGFGSMRKLTNKLAPVLHRAHSHRMLLPLVADCAMWIIGFSVALILRILNNTPLDLPQIVVACSVAILGQVTIGAITGTYRARWRVTSFEEVASVSVGWFAVAVLSVLASQLARGAVFTAPRFSVIAGTIVAGYGMLVIRALWRYLWQMQRRPVIDDCKRTIVLGAGDGGEQMVRAMLADPNSTYYPVALLDDDKSLRNRRIANAVVEGTRQDIGRVARKYDAQLLLVAITGATAGLIQEVCDLAMEAGLEVRVLPETSELVRKMTVADMRHPTVEDLLGRDPVEIDLEALAGYIRNRRVLITGAGGSIGSELSRQVSGLCPAELMLLDRDETALHGLQLSMEGRALLDSDDLIVADIRDRDRIFEIFAARSPEVVFHAAALKHLTLLENHPEEGLKTNVYGSKNVLDAAVRYGVDRFVNVSTDKAADPTSVLGATKLAAERLTALAARTEGGAYLSVRFGNVLGSRGSVLPIFLDQISRGHNLTVTDPEVTRYFMTIPEAVRLVLQAGAIGGPGEVLILDMGQPVKIIDLAHRLIRQMDPSLEVEITGLRPGEKLHEVLIASDEVGVSRIHPRIMHTRAEPAEPAQALHALGQCAVDEATLKLVESSLVLG
ncbi:MAG: nucleoside-diphosphate sugar epimerase/dehydratase, partial [Actinomycetota bacterium]